MIIMSIIRFLKFFLLCHFCLVYLPTALASLPPGVMLLNPSTLPRDSATDIEKTSQKGAREREWPKRCLARRMAVHACQIGLTDTTPPCPGSPHRACVVTRGREQPNKSVVKILSFWFFFFHLSHTEKVLQIGYQVDNLYLMVFL